MTEIDTIKGIIKYKEYTFWTHASIVDNYIFEFLDTNFPESLILPEFNNIDWFVMSENLPIEIQSTRITPTGTPAHSNFENAIRQQLEQNIGTYEKCWFFMDSEYLRYLQLIAGRNISMNMDWFYKLMREEKLIVFTISYDCKIEMKTYKDFDWISKLSSTCILGEDKDSRILEQNKSKIATNIFNNIGVTSEEVRIQRKLFDERSIDNVFGRSFPKWLRHRQGANEREKLIGSIYISIGSLNAVNACLSCNTSDYIAGYAVGHLNDLGLTEVIYGRSTSTIKRYVDKYDIAIYFPGYLRNKEKWDYLRDNKMSLNVRQFNAVITGKVNPLDWKNLANSGWDNTDTI